MKGRAGHVVIFARWYTVRWSLAWSLVLAGGFREFPLRPLDVREKSIRLAVAVDSPPRWFFFSFRRLG